MLDSTLIEHFTDNFPQSPAKIDLLKTAISGKMERKLVGKFDN
jgi:hypothetical protein